MLLYKEYFNTGVSIYISHITIFTFTTSYVILDFLTQRSRNDVILPILVFFYSSHFVFLFINTNLVPSFLYQKVLVNFDVSVET